MLRADAHRAGLLPRDLAEIAFRRGVVLAQPSLPCDEQAIAEARRFLEIVARRRFRHVASEIGDCER